MKSWPSYVCALGAVTGVMTGAVTAQTPAPARTIEVTAGDYKFQPEVIEVAEGERVVLKARVTDGKKHGLAIKEFGIKSALPKTGELVAIEFVAGKPGTYTVSCSVYCGKGHSQMKSRLVVTARK